MKPNPELDPIRQLAASIALIRADVRSQRLLLLKLNPDLSIDGEPVKEWLYRAQRACLERELGHLADENPALASYVKKMLDDLGKRDDDPS